MAFLGKFFALGLLFSFPLALHAATLSVTPSSSSSSLGSKSTIQVSVSSPSTPINALAGVLTIPPFLSIESVSRSGSILNFWVTEPTFSNTTKTVTFEGVSLTGFQGVSGLVLTVTVRSTGLGVGRISFQSGQIFANDGSGTDVTEDLLGASLEILPKTEEPSISESDERIEQDNESVIQQITPPIVVVEERHGSFFVRGITQYPNVPVVLSFKNQTGVKVYVTTYTNEQGIFEEVVPVSLRPGTYRVTASLVLPNGAQSSDSREVRAVVGGIAGLEFSHPTVLFFLTLLLGLLALAFSMVWRTNTPTGFRKKFSVLILGEVDDARKIVRKSFKLLHDDVREVIKQPGKNRSSRLVEIQHNLDEAEEVIQKEIDDIRDTLYGDQK